MITQNIHTEMDGLFSDNTDKEFFLKEGRGVPFEDIQQALDYLPYAHPIRIGLLILHYTGCRQKELELMEFKGLHGNWIIWDTAKKQKKYRKEYLPDEFLEEYAAYRVHQKIMSKQFYHVKGSTLTRKFNLLIRQQLAGNWTTKIPVPQRKNSEMVLEYQYALQLKGLRKNFATMLFYHFWQRFGSAEMAMHLTAARMKHSTTGMTVTHYILAAEQIQAEKYKGMLPFQTIKQVNQTKLGQWFL